VGEVLVSDRTAAKIRRKHGLDPTEIARLVASPPPKIGTFVPGDHGSRLYVNVRTHDGAEVLVVLYPADNDGWRLASAYVHRRPRRARWRT
jgi:hypothetical protein